MAQEEACSGPYTEQTMGDQLGQIQSLIDNQNLVPAQKGIRQIKKQIVCLPTLVNRAHLALFARAYAVLSFYDQDEESALRWEYLAQYTDPSLNWPEFLHNNHAFQELLRESQAPSLAGPTERSLAVPPKGAVFLNGTLLSTPIALTETPQLVQVFDKNQVMLQAYWQDGAAFRSDLLIPSTSPYPIPSWVSLDRLTPLTTQPSPNRLKVSTVRRREFDPTAPPKAAVYTSAGLAILSATLYTAAAINTAKLDQHSTEQRLRSGRTLSNILVLGSSVSAAGAIGVGVTLFVGDQRGVQLNVRF